MNGLRTLLDTATVVDVVIAVLGVVTLAAGVAVVTTRRVLHAALWLVVALVAPAMIFLVMTAELVAWVQVLIYVGAVVVVLLFAVMLTRGPSGPSTELSGRNRVAALVAAVATAVVLGVLAAYGFAGAYADLGRTHVGAPAAVGAALFRSWVLPFEVLSLLLLASLVGAIVVSRTRGGGAVGDGDGAEGRG